MGVPELTQAINAYHSVSVSSEFQELERMRVKADHDEARALWKAERKKAFEIAKNLLGIGDSVDKIISVTGLNRKEKVDVGGYGIRWNDTIDLSCNELYENGAIV